MRLEHLSPLPPPPARSAHSSSSHAHDLGLARTVSAILDHAGATSPLFTRQPGGRSAGHFAQNFGALPYSQEEASSLSSGTNFTTDNDAFTTQVIYEPPTRSVSAPNAPLQCRRRVVRCERKRPDDRPLFLVAKKLCDDRGIVIESCLPGQLTPITASSEPPHAEGPAAARPDAASRASGSSADSSTPSSPAVAPLGAAHANRELTWAPLPPLRRGLRS